MTTAAVDQGSSETDGTISYDECFDLLSNHRRRYVLHYLQENGEETTISDLTEQVAAWENEVTTEEISYNQRKRVYTSLQQVHLPRMDDADVVEFDDSEGTITIGPAAADLDIYLDVVDRQDIPWSYLYVGLATINIAIIGAFRSGFWPVTALPDSALSIFVATTFLATSLIHLYLTRTEMHLGGEDAPPSGDR